MMDILPLIQNETLKIWKKKRFYVILLILLVLIPLFTYAQMRMSQTNADNFKDWRNQIQQQITDLQNTLASDRMPEEWKKYDRIKVQQLQYYLDHDVNPNSPDAATFTRQFMASSVSLFFPLLILALASDLVSGERTSGTIKMLLTRPVKRWKILFSKLIALTLYVSLAIITTGAVCYLISGLVFGYGGWTMPVFTGFVINSGSIDASGVHPVPQWQFVIMQSGLILGILYDNCDFGAYGVGACAQHGGKHRDDDGGCHLRQHFGRHGFLLGDGQIYFLRQYRFDRLFGGNTSADCRHGHRFLAFCAWDLDARRAHRVVRCLYETGYIELK
ncbi:ABC-2 family transporter protein [Paenibacillaceae bacterium GAS479]|nr:ABC-2 family transporter protein [Paenibacillaceae bacterium GAS479]